MSLDLPSASNGYLFHPDHKLAVPLFQALFTELHQRFNDVEAITDQVQAVLSDENSSLLQDAFDNTLTPLLTQMQTELATMETAISAAEDQLIAIQAGAVAAENITLAAIEGLDADNAQLALAELLTMIGQQAEALQSIEMNPLETKLLVAAGSLHTSKINLLAPTESADFAFPVDPAVGQAVRVIDGDAISETVAINLTSTASVNGSNDPYSLKSGADQTFVFLGGNWKLITASGGSGGSYATSLIYN